jgi:hypothetical protein
VQDLCNQNAQGDIAARRSTLPVTHRYLVAECIYQRTVTDASTAQGARAIRGTVWYRKEGTLVSA